MDNPIPLSISLYSVAQIRALETSALQPHQSSMVLMQRAGDAACHYLRQHWPHATRIIIFCGCGNNGGDGYVTATQVKAHGLSVSVRHVGEVTALPEPAATALAACRAAGVDIRPFNPNEPIDADLIVDALLGIGLNAEVKPPYRDAIVVINAASCPVLALDIPSGVNADTGCVTSSFPPLRGKVRMGANGVAVQAERTLTFIGVKRGLVTGQAPAYCGAVDCDTLGISPTLLQQVTPAATTLIGAPSLPPRRRDAHKGDFGHVLVIGGNYGMGGAVQLAATAALRIGAGLVSVATRPEHVGALLAARPEIMAHGISTIEALQPLLARATVIVLGIGLGQDDWARGLYQAALATHLPTVIDADALNLLARDDSRGSFILTPHPGEAARLLNTTTQAVQADRYAAASQLQQHYGGVVVLKGAGSIVQGESQPRVCTAGNPGMASGGMGDVLAGVIGGLLAQGCELQHAAELGVWLHARAADQAAQAGGERGLLALDVVAQLKNLFLSTPGNKSKPL